MPTANEEPEPWRYSEAKAQVKLLLESDEMYMNMPEQQLYMLSEMFQKYRLDRFVDNVGNLKKSIKAQRQQVQRQEAALVHDRQLFPIQDTTFWGYPRWDTHEAKAQLQKDVQQKRQTTMEPKQLHAMREEYHTDFSLGVFRKHIYQEEYAQSGRSYWMAKKMEKAEKKRAAKKKK